MSQYPELDAWVERLLASYNIQSAAVDVDRVLALAGEAAHAVMRPAAPVTTYVAGFAAGLAAARHNADSDEAAEAAMAVAHQLLAEVRTEPPAGDAE